MKLGIMQPYFFPYIGYFQLINTVDKFVIFDDVNFIKKGWINRNRILLNDQEFIFTISLDKVSQNKLIREISLSSNTIWRGKLLKTIERSYKRAPFFNFAFPLIEETILFEERNLSLYVSHSIEKLCKYLNITTFIVRSSCPYETTSLKGQEKILEICRKEKADKYINPIGGKEIYSNEIFQQNNIELSFLKSSPIRYVQTGRNFIPWLSIIDVMMFNEKSKISGFLNDFELL